MGSGAQMTPEPHSASYPPLAQSGVSMRGKDKSTDRFVRGSLDRRRDRPLAGLRPSRLNASGLTVVGPRPKPARGGFVVEWPVYFL